MHKLLGVILLVAGTAGFSLCICRERQVRLGLLKEVKYMYQLIQNEIRYSVLPLPEIFKTVAEKVKEPFGAMLSDVSKRMDWEKGEALCFVWRKEVEEKLDKVPFTAKQKEALLRFPECMGLSESEGQANAIGRKLEELDNWIDELEEEIKSKNKVIMSLGISAGVMLSILLL